ncbi:hypothetical protein Golax_021155 [Gossypium laxum]|uniref:Uncharacterized protein n=1 Tax=Gossypium laxum TaxID=34288 RepID=A0A7J9AK66_9ROSI|nr:hypothetical protein [Gossypium laxum]
MGSGFLVLTDVWGNVQSSMLNHGEV